MELIKLDSNIFNISWRRIQIHGNKSTDDIEYLDLCYEEDSRAAVDFNVVMTDKDEFIELQATAEGDPFSREIADRLIELAKTGIGYLLEIQRDTIRSL